jgi:PKD repeat protein
MKKIATLLLFGLLTPFFVYTQIISDFEIDTENWHSEGDGSYYWESGAGNPGGCFRVDDDATGSMNRAYAPVKFLGDWSAATITDYISADFFLSTSSSIYVSPNFVFKIEGPGGSAIALNNPIPQPAIGEWTTYTVNLAESNWYIEQGTWTEILDHITSFIVTMEYINGDEFNRLDNVILSINPVQIPISPGLCTDFENGLFGGWSTISSGTKSIQSTGGNPGKYLQINDGSGTSLAVPPSIYHGNWSELDEHAAEIHVDYLIKNIDGATYIHDFFVKLSGPGGEATYPLDYSIEYAFNKWHSFGIPIEQSEWTMLNGDWNSLMNFVDDIQLIAEFISGGETVGIDNFCISNSPPVTDFIADKTFVFPGDPIQFYDKSTSAPQEWSWDFGDSGASFEVNPTHTYTDPGIYTVSLTTTNYFGNSTVTKTEYIEVFPIDQCLKFEDNFDDNTIHPAWLFKNGIWSETSQQMRQSSNHYVTNNFLEGCFAVSGSLQWENYILSCDFYSSDNDYIGFVYHYQDEQNMYMFRWSKQEQLRTLSKYVEGVETILSSESIAYIQNEWYYFDMISYNGQIVIAINGSEIISVFDNSYLSGKTGLYCWGNQSSYFDNFKVECIGKPVELSIFLEGPMGGTEMMTDLNSQSLLPLANPYTSAPWNYPGNDGVSSFSNPDIVDWVLVDFRDATSAANALPGTSVETKAALLLSDGQVISPYGELPLFLNKEILNSLFVMVWHRNHLGILSAEPMMDFGGTYLYDFTTAVNQAYGTNAQKDLGNGIFGLYTGDLNADGIVNELDKELSWGIEAGESGYIPSDCNLDGQADNLDKNDYWVENLNKSSQVPD